MCNDFLGFLMRENFRCLLILVNVVYSSFSIQIKTSPSYHEEYRQTRLKKSIYRHNELSKDF